MAKKNSCYATLLGMQELCEYQLGSCCKPPRKVILFSLNMFSYEIFYREKH